jgi:hypothetical protein
MDVSWLRALTRRYEKDIGIQEKVRMPGKMGKGPSSSFKDALWEDIMLGDTKSASERISKYMATVPADQRKEAYDSIKATVAARQPVRVGTGDEDMRVHFLNWVDRNLQHDIFGYKIGKDDVARVHRIDEAYRKTAIALGLFKPPEVTDQSLQESMARNVPIHQ